VSLSKCCEILKNCSDFVFRVKQSKKCWKKLSDIMHIPEDVNLRKQFSIVDPTSLLNLI
jgi:hypothetical protein